MISQNELFSIISKLNWINTTSNYLILLQKLFLMNVAIIGGGAAGFFSAIHVKLNFPNAKVTLFEKSNKLLSKVKISGGGRCNVTNACSSISTLSKAYPRGGKALKKIFPEFYTKHTMEWFGKRGVALLTQEDQCVFPVSQNSQTIIDCFLQEALRLGVEIKTQSPVQKLTPKNGQIYLHVNENEISFDYVIVATGGSPKKSGLIWLENLGHKIENPVPSLFTFNMPDETIRDLMGVVVEEALVKIKGEKLEGNGPVLITHWGMSGPAILKLSAFGARILAEKNYNFSIEVNWVNESNHILVMDKLEDIIESHSEKQLQTIRPYYLPTRLWLYLLNRHQLNSMKKWRELSKKEKNKIVQLLCNDSYQVRGKTTFKEEFVTCGGVSLDSIYIKNMQSKVVPNLFFTGEVCDIDGLTGGYNFQAAWTTAFIAAKLGN